MPVARPKKPKWWLNSYFWFTAILLLIALIGVVSGEESIRDPGQTKDRNLVLIYLAGAALMGFGGFMSHSIAVRAYHEELEEAERSSPSKKSVSVPSASSLGDSDSDPERVVDAAMDAGDAAADAEVDLSDDPKES